MDREKIPQKWTIEAIAYYIATAHHHAEGFSEMGMVDDNPLRLRHIETLLEMQKKLSHANVSISNLIKSIMEANK